MLDPRSMMALPRAGNAEVAGVPEDSLIEHVLGIHINEPLEQI